MKPKVLFIDDEINALKTISLILKKAGFEVTTAKTAEEGIAKLQNFTPDCILLDYLLPSMSGIEMLKWLKKENYHVPVIIITAFGTIERAVEAMKLGAFHFLVKPVDTDLLINILKEATLKQKVFFEDEDEYYKRKFPEIIGKSRAIKEVLKIIEMVAESNANVLITGETGTGKELVARAIHKNSLRKEKPFIIVDCTTIPENLLEAELFGYEKGAFTGATESKKGLVELSNGGTLFLDEIGDLPLSLQKKLLRFLQEKEIKRLGSLNRIKVDVRVIASTNQDLEKAIKEGKFREDLYWRLNVVRIHLPPLRERKEDIPLLVRHFLNKYAQENNKPIPEIEPGVIDILMEYDWPGNVRELAHVIERAVVLSPSGIIQIRHLPKRILEKLKSENENENKENKEETLNLLEIEKKLIIKALNETGWNQSKAAKILGISRKQLRTKMKKFGLLPS